MFSVIRRLPTSTLYYEHISFKLMIGTTVSDTKKRPLRARLSFDFGGQGFRIRKESMVKKRKNAMSENSRAT
jgi:hypothetical protein